MGVAAGCRLAIASVEAACESEPVFVAGKPSRSRSIFGLPSPPRSLPPPFDHPSTRLSRRTDPSCPHILDKRSVEKLLHGMPTAPCPLCKNGAHWHAKGYALDKQRLAKIELYLEAAAMAESRSRHDQRLEDGEGRSSAREAASAASAASAGGGARSRRG